MSGKTIELVEVGPRDGFQSVDAFIPTAIKIDIIQRLHAAGIRRMEATSFVNPSAVPQLADAAEILQAAHALDRCDPQVLVPTARQAERALAAGARHLSFVLSVSPSHNRSNVRRSPAESVEEYTRLLEFLPAGTKVRLNLATAFDCPYDGAVDPADTLALLDQLVPLSPAAEIALCDTTGRVTPLQVQTLFRKAGKRFPEVSRWAFHGHDTYGMGTANVLAAWQAGVRAIDASVAGLGGCPFAPGATGNVATEDALYLFDGLGVETGISLPALLDVARQVAALPSGQVGGRVRQAVDSARRRQNV